MFYVLTERNVSSVVEKMNLDGSHILNNEKVIRSFCKDLKKIIPNIFKDCVLKEAGDIAFKKNIYAQSIHGFIISSCNKRKDLMAIYEWAGLPKYEIMTLSQEITFYDFLRDYKQQDGSYRILNKVIEDLKLVLKVKGLE